MTPPPAAIALTVRLAWIAHADFAPTLSDDAGRYDLIARSLAVFPEERYPDAGDFAAALRREQARGERPVSRRRAWRSATTPPSASRCSRARRRSR